MSNVGLIEHAEYIFLLIWICFCEYSVAFDTTALFGSRFLCCYVLRLPKGIACKGPRHCVYWCLLMNALCDHSAAQRRTELWHCITKRCGAYKPVTWKAAHRNLEWSSKGWTDRCNSRDLWQLKMGLFFLGERDSFLISCILLNSDWAEKANRDYSILFRGKSEVFCSDCTSLNDFSVETFSF